MKQLIALFLLVVSMLPQTVWALCDSPMTGESKTYSVAIYTVGACLPNAKFPDDTEVIEFKRLNGDASSVAQSVRLSDECKWTNKRSRLSCAKSGRSPLAGTTYVETQDWPDICDASGKALVRRLTCVKACKAGRAPKHLIYPPAEC